MIAIQQSRLEVAEQSLRQAIGLEPSEASFHATRAQICLLDQKWEAALESADKGLTFKPG